jgi:hypothetical protein
MKELFVAWILTMMTVTAPPSRFESAATKDAKESVEDASARYREIATDIVEASFQEDVKPAFGGVHGRAKTALAVAAIFFTESGFRRDVDLGTNHASERKKGLNDFGHSWCMGQLNLGWKMIPDPEHEGGFIDTSTRKTLEGWTGRDLLSDRRKCIIATITHIRSSLSVCYHLPLAERLAQYARGSCLSAVGRRMSRAKMFVYARWQKSIPSILDVELLEAMRNEIDEDEEVTPAEYSILSSTFN